MRDLLKCLAAVAALAFCAAPAGAQAPARRPDPGPTTPCAARGEVVAKLAKNFGETLRSMGLQRADSIVEVYASAKTGTWTILVTRPDGTSCLIAAGRMWEDMSEPPGEPA